MQQVPVTMAWLVNSFENSSQHSEHYIDVKTGDVSFLVPMDLPQHDEKMKKFDLQPDRFLRLPKLDPDFSMKIKQDYIALQQDPYLQELLRQAMDVDIKFRNVLMEYEEERRNWYKFQDERLAEYLREWFRERGFELVDRPPVNALEYNKAK